MRPGLGKPLGFQQITSLSSATGLTLPSSDARVAIIRCTTQNVRWRDDGTNPTASVGIPMLPGDMPIAFDGDLNTIKFIEETSGGILNVSYYS